MKPDSKFILLYMNNLIGLANPPGENFGNTR